MAALAVYGVPAALETTDLQPALFDEFVRFIDRGQRTTQTYLTNLRQFAAWLRYSMITRPTRQDVICYRDYLGTEHDAIQYEPATAAGWSYRTDRAGNRCRVKCAANTIAQYLRSVCQFFKWTAAEGLYPDIAANIHAPKIRHDTHRKDALTAADVLTIEKDIAAAAEEKTTAAAAATKDAAGRTIRATEQGKRLAAMYALAVNSGLRTVELSRANVRDLEMRNGIAILWVHGKGHTEPDTRKILAPEVYEVLESYLQSRNDATANSPLFVSTGNRSGGKRIAPTTISKMLKQAMQHAGFDSNRITAHSLRHTAGTAAMETTGDLYKTQLYMRHADPKTTQIYLHTDTERADAETAQQVYNYYHGVTETRSDLAAILQGMTPAQVEQLTTIAAAMSR